MRTPIFTLLFFLSSQAVIINPVVDTDRSVNTFSLQTIVADVVSDTMTDEQKLEALFTFQRRMMHHYRTAQSVEDGTTTFDPVKLYTVYGCAWCTQSAGVFRALCSEVFGRSNTEGLTGTGTLASQGVSGYHSTFQLRFNASDAWHWVDPIIGAYARNPVTGAIASLDDIASNPAILIDAEEDGRASMPYFPCNKGGNLDSFPLFSYFDYDTAFIIDYASNHSPNPYTNQSAFFDLGRRMQKGESYTWYWDFLPGDYFNIQLLEYGPTDASGRYIRDTPLYPPRHLWGWKDSLDRKNWPFFKPYGKVIKGDTCYRYYANGIHVFEPALRSSAPKDRPYFNRHAAFYADDGLMPALRPALTDSVSEIAYHVKLPYPLMDLRISCDYTRRGADDSVSVSLSRLYFIHDDIHADPDSYKVWLSQTTPALVKSLDVSENGRFDTTLREWVDRACSNRTYQGYVIRFSMRARNAATDAGLNRFRVECVFQHNMFALPQFMPGPNRVTVSAEPPSDLAENPLQVGFSFMDNGVARTDERIFTFVPAVYTVTVDQPEVPKMLSMRMASLSADSLPTEKGKDGGREPGAGLACAPTPFNPTMVFTLTGAFSRGASLRILDLSGRLVADLSGRVSAGRAVWTAEGLASGVYVAVAGNRKMSVKKRIVYSK